MKTLPAFFMAFLCLNFAYAQKVISGKVTEDGSDFGLAGISVTGKGSNISTVTDIYGDFTLEIPNEISSLIFEGEGFERKELAISNRSSITTSLTSSSTTSTSDNLSVGFGTQSKSQITGSIAQIKSEDFEGAPVIDLEQANQGRASGIFIQNNSGKLGEGATVRVRGGSTISGSNQPLFVIDGVPVSAGVQSNINPSNIASLEVLKDASAAAIYGSRAANGVVIITTKSGQSGKTKFDFDYQFGVAQTPKTLDLYNRLEFNQQLIEGLLRIASLDSEITRENLERWAASGSNVIDLTGNNSAGITSFTISVLDSLNNETDWQDEVFRSALSHRTSFNASGGTNKFNYFAGLAYVDQEGILIGNDFQRLNGRLNIGSQVSNSLKIDLSVNYAYTDDNRLNDDQDLGSPLQALVLPPSDTYDPSNNYQLDVFSQQYNPLTEINFSDNVAQANSIIGNLGLLYQITDELSFKAEGGIDYFDQDEERRQGPETLEGAGTGQSRLSETQISNVIANGYFNYENEVVSGHELSVLLGSSYQSSTTESAFRSASVNSIATLRGLSTSDAQLFNPLLPDSKFAFLSFYSRVNYVIDDKYSFQVSGRADGSSRFSEDNRVGFFPAVSAGWNISQEDFFSSSFLSFLKIKASFGIVGNTPQEDFLYRRNYFTINYGRGGNNEGIRLSNLANADLKWESTAQTDIGLEFGIANDRITGGVDYYIKNTTDLLFPVPVSPTSGFSRVLKNIGSLNNKGIEFFISTVNVDLGDFKWSTDFNISSNTNEVTDIGGNNLIVGVNAFIEGQPSGVFYARKFVGVNTANGDPLYDDGEGGTTDDYEAAPRMVIGNPNPDFYGGLGNTLVYKNFDLTFLFQFVQGVDIYNATSEFLSNSGIATLTQTQDQLDRWYQSGDEAPFPVFNPFQENTNPSSRFIEDGSYIRLKALTLNYQLPSVIVSGWGLSYFKVYIGGQNLLTFTDYSGFDPDVNYVDSSFGSEIERNISRGIDNFTAPQARTFITGLKIGF